MTKISKILTGSGVTVLLGGSAPFTMGRDHKLFEELLVALSDKDAEAIEDIIDMANKVETFSQGKVRIVDGEVYVGEEVIANVVADRILELMSLDLDFEYMAKFLENLMLNPSFQSRQELYLFLENGEMPITEDGRFLAYKWVKNDYTDCHTGTFSNKPGCVVKMLRQNVNDDRRQTCSSGLHVCTQHYEKFGPKLMLVAINPKDVVSVPHDYENAKMRVCEYEVLKELNVDEFGTHQRTLQRING